MFDFNDPPDDLSRGQRLGLEGPMNPYLNNLNKIEFVMTEACTGACRHCSQGDHKKAGGHLDPKIGIEVIRAVAARFEIRTLLVFGGEPLLYPDATAELIKAAREAGIKRRQIITNGYFTKSENEMRRVAKLLAENGCNDLLLSVDAFHQETIPLETVRLFALFAKEALLPLRLQPAWLKSREDPNAYNRKTHAILDKFQTLGFPISEGNIVFPEGNARRYLSEYFTDKLPQNPYEEDPEDLHTLSIDPKGFLLGQSVTEKPVLQILEEYQP